MVIYASLSYNGSVLSFLKLNVIGQIDQNYRFINEIYFWVHLYLLPYIRNKYKQFQMGHDNLTPIWILNINLYKHKRHFSNNFKNFNSKKLIIIN